MSNIVAVAGPTASGKSALSLALCKAMNGELVSFLDKDQLPAVFMFCQALTDLAALILALRQNEKDRKDGKKNESRDIEPRS